MHSSVHQVHSVFVRLAVFSVLCYREAQTYPQGRESHDRLLSAALTITHIFASCLLPAAELLFSELQRTMQTQTLLPSPHYLRQRDTAVNNSYTTRDLHRHSVTAWPQLATKKSWIKPPSSTAAPHQLTGLLAIFLSNLPGTSSTSNLPQLSRPAAPTLPPHTSVIGNVLLPKLLYSCLKGSKLLTVVSAHVKRLHNKTSMVHPLLLSKSWKWALMGPSYSCFVQKPLCGFLLWSSLRLLS